MAHKYEHVSTGAGFSVKNGTTKTEVISQAGAFSKAGGVSLANLATGITPSHVTKYAGTTSAYAGGGTSNAWTVTGAAATDVVSAVIRASTNAVSIAKAVLTTNTLTVHFSADPGADTTVDYVILRGAA